MSVGQPVEWGLAAEPKYSEKKITRSIACPGLEFGQRRGGMPATNFPSYGTPLMYALMTAVRGSPPTEETQFLRHTGMGENLRMIFRTTLLVTAGALKHVLK
jgi:hypothetical protein